MPRLLPWPLLALAVIAGNVTPTGAVAGQATESDAAGESAHQAANALLSLVLPGAAQLREDRSRGWVFVALEAVAWVAWAERRHRAGELRNRYRDLAWDEARDPAGPRVDGDFSYYETMSLWDRSGTFDASPAPGVQPEKDPGTYNGSIWHLAQGLFLPPGGAAPGSPSYERAVAYYRDRAYGETFLWDWTGNPDAQGEMTRLIERSDDRFRQATLVLGAVLVNHVSAAVDAWVSAPSSLEHTTLRIRPGPPGLDGSWRVSLHIGALP
jgi:hypothetical protein